MENRLHRERQILQFQGQDIRVLNEDGHLWFVAKDLCRALNVKRIKTVLKFVAPNEKKMLHKFLFAKLDQKDSNKHSEIKVIHENGVRHLLSIASRGNAPELGHLIEKMSEELKKGE